VGGTPVLDVRQDSEFDAGHIPGARHIELGALPAQASELPAGPTVVMCGHSERAMGAASLLARAGRSDISVLDGGPQAWADATGESLEVGA
jgi:rhodanese-related sulfurtransferase